VTVASVGLVLVGAGSSLRMGDIDKVWAPVAGKPLFMHSIERLCPLAGTCVLVVRRDRVDPARRLVGSAAFIDVVEGGTTRQESVWNGIRALPPVDVIAVHDVARPLAPPELLREGLQILADSDADGAIPVIPVADTIKTVDSRGRVMATPDRAAMRGVQTPQVFRADVLTAAHEAGRAESLSATDDAVLLEAMGNPVQTFPGSPENFKVTTALDLRLAEYLLERQTRS
jgi:2-C-methyl-D-erythritol 4-phosphate cytidylyltransferase